LQVAVVDRTPIPHHRDANAWGILYLYDLDGKEIWKRQQEKGAWCIATVPVRWFSADGPQGIFVYGHGPGRPACVYDGQGNIAVQLPMQYSAYRDEKDRQTEFYGHVADVWGDSREEVILFGPRALCIYANAAPAEISTQYNETLYPGM